MSDRCVILLNHKAGALHAKVGHQQVEKMAREIDLDAEVISSASTDEMRQTVKRLVGEGAAKIGIAGGDGTVGIAIQELAHTNTALAIIAQGTFNNFASALRLPNAIPSALQVLKDGEVQEVSLGKIGDKYFKEAAGVGLFADALALYGAGSNKNFARGFYAMTRLGLAFKPHTFQITVDGQVHEERAVMCTVANSYRMAQALPIAPFAKVTDDVLDIVIIGNLKRKEILPYYKAIRAQMHLDLPKVTMLQGKEIQIKASRRLNVHSDDHIEGTTPVVITVDPRALKVLVDKL